MYLDNLRSCPEVKNVEVVGFIDDSPDLQGQRIMGVPVIGSYQQLPELMKEYNIEGLIVAYSDRLMKIREERFNGGRELGLKPVTIIHPSAVMSPSVKIGEGVLIGKGVLMDTEVRIGDNCSVHRGTTIGEDSVLEENVWITAGVNLAAHVTVRKNTMIGTGANVIPRCTIGKNVIVGAGAVVINDIPDNVTVVGVPAKIIKTREEVA